MRQEQRVPVRGSLQRKLLRTLLVVVLLVGVGTLSVVAYWSARTSQSSLDTISGHIAAQLDAKGRGLVENHTLALKGMIQDNAFSDIQVLIARTVDNDSDVVYGVLTDAQGQKLAFAAHGALSGDAKAKAPWQAIGLPEALPAAAQLGVQHVRLLSDEVLEVAAPIIVDKEVAGTLRYGISTRKMQEALFAAKAQARADLMFTLFSLCGLVAVVGATGVVLGRREAARIVQPLNALTVAARSLAAGDREVRVAIRSGDELELLGETFDQMAADLATSYRSLEELNQGLERKVEARTAELGTRNRDMRIVLDNVAQGLITIDSDGLMAPERSAVVEKWFGPVAEGQKLPDYLGSKAAIFADDLRLGLMQLQDAFLPAELLLGQMPRSLTVGERAYRLTYEAIGDDDPIRGILVMIEDITEILAGQREERAQREVLRAVRHLTQDRGGFLSFLGEANQLLAQISAGGDLADIKRAIHTLKGNASLLDLQVVAGLCHTMESTMAANELPPLPNELNALTRRWSDLMDALEPFMRGAKREIIEIPRTELETLLGRLRMPDGLPEVQRQLNGWTLEPVAKPLERLAEQAKGLATLLGRGDITCPIEFDNTRLDPDIWAPFWSAMSHVVRNAVDHGLETPEERASNGKGAARLVFRATTDGPEMTIRVSDDGRGVDWEALRAKMRAVGLPSSTREDLVNAMLSDGISTRTEQSETSGRGVGMAAVKKTIQRMGGKLAVESTPNKGTTWIFTFPVAVVKTKKVAA
jgi:signal transduction histidine kinase